jgi:hypothetical protein
MFFGLNGNNTRSSIRWDRTDLGDALAALRPGVLRYPGGTIANYWDWRSGWFQPNGPWPPQAGKNGQPIPQFDNSLTPFRAALTRTGAEALFVLNMHTIDGRLATAGDSPRLLQDQIDFLQAAANLGIPVKRIELGNEFYLSAANAPDFSVRFPTAESYAQEASMWAQGLHAAFPGAKVAAVATNATNANSTRRETWNAKVLPLLTDVDAVTMHPYAYANPPDAALTHQAWLARTYTWSRAIAIEEFPQFAPYGLEAWLTEFNMNDKTSERKFAGTWTHGLFTAAYSIQLAQHPVVTSMQHHNVLGDVIAGILFDTTAGFGTSTPATTFLGRSAAGAAYRILLQATSSSVTGQVLSFPGGPVLSGGVPALVGMDFANAAGHQCVVVNLAGAAVTLDLTRLFSGSVSWSRTTAGSLSTRVTGPSSLTVTSGVATGMINIPRHSITRIFR